MKFLITLISAMFLSFSAFSADIDQFYQPKFEIVSVSSMCPPPAPGSATCAARGTMIKVKAMLSGCLDEVKFFNAQYEREKNTGDVEIYIASLAAFPEANYRVRCARLPEASKTIYIPYSSIGEINITNQSFDL